MTRINANISIKELTDQHLGAEHRELQRICSNYKVRLNNNTKILEAQPIFTLGGGHVIFFIDKGLFTRNRQENLMYECHRRGINATSAIHRWEIYEPEHMNNYAFSEQENDLVRRRIAERIIESEQVPRYYKEDISKREAINLLSFNDIKHYEYAMAGLECMENNGYFKRTEILRL